MRRPIHPDVKAEALRLRIEERLSLVAIQEALDEHVAKATLSVWLRAHPLTPAELRGRMREGGVEGNRRRWLRGSKPARPR